MILSMIIFTKQLIISSLLFGIGITSFLGYNTMSLVFGEVLNNNMPPIDDQSSLPPHPPNSGCVSPCPPNAEACIMMCLPTNAN